MVILSMHLYTSDDSHAWFHLHDTRRPASNASKAKKKAKWKILAPSGTLLYIIYMYFPFKCIHLYKFENDEVDIILFCKPTVLCYISEYTL